MRSETDLLPPRYRARDESGTGAWATSTSRPTRCSAARWRSRCSPTATPRTRESASAFTREALAAARLSGEPGTVTIFDVGEWDGRPFIVMEHLAGGSLEDMLRRDGAQPPARALAWLEQAAAALDAAHRHGVVHRDVKPANLLLDERGEVRVADFGIASAAGMRLADADRHGARHRGLPLARAGDGRARDSGERPLRARRSSPTSCSAASGRSSASARRPRRPLTSSAPVPSISGAARTCRARSTTSSSARWRRIRTARYGTAREFVADLRGALTALPRARPASSPRPAGAPGSRARRGLVAAALLAAAMGPRSPRSSARRRLERQQVVTQTTSAGTTAPPTVQADRRPGRRPAPPPPPPPAGRQRALPERPGLPRCARGDTRARCRSAGGRRRRSPARPYEAYAEYDLGEAFANYNRAATRSSPARPLPGQGGPETCSAQKPAASHSGRSRGNGLDRHAGDAG